MDPHRSILTDSLRHRLHLPLSLAVVHQRCVHPLSRHEQSLRSRLPHSPPPHLHKSLRFDLFPRRRELRIDVHRGRNRPSLHRGEVLRGERGNDPHVHASSACDRVYGKLFLLICLTNRPRNLPASRAKPLPSHGNGVQIALALVVRAASQSLLHALRSEIGLYPRSFASMRFSDRFGRFAGHAHHSNHRCDPGATPRAPIAPRFLHSALSHSNPGEKE